MQFWPGPEVAFGILLLAVALGLLFNISYPQVGLPIQRPILLLTFVFIAWKTTLFVVILSSPGPGYDTSTSLLDISSSVPTNQPRLRPTLSILHPPILKFVRWDAIYFTHIIREGHVFEQEWAFGLGLSSPVSFIAQGISHWTTISRPLLEIGVAIVLSHATHFLTAVILYGLSQRTMRNQTATSLLAAVVHIVSPAGAFLSAPCSESLFSCLNFLGFYFYVDGRNSTSLNQNLETVLAGLVIGCATIVRSNGILSGLPFLYDAALQLFNLFRNGSSVRKIRRLSALVGGGCLIAVGAAFPQYLAYIEYCTNAVQRERRPWCDFTFPSIYGWVQQHYWNVGFLQYWTLSNVPLFILAMPCLAVLTLSSLWAFTYVRPKLHTTPGPRTHAAVDGGSLLRLAMPQLVLAMAALTIYHVQIINRLSSGYPLWYIWLASMITDMEGHENINPVKGRAAALFMVSLSAMYAMIQGGLFASFLPPA